MPVHAYTDPDYFDTLTAEPLRFTRDLGLEAGLQLGTVLVGDDPAVAPAVMMLELPPGYALPRHSHGTHRVEVVVRGSVELADGRVLTAGDVWTSGPDELYGPHRAGPDGVLTAEIFASCEGLAPSPDPDAEGDDAAAEMTSAIGARARAHQGH